MFEVTTNLTSCPKLIIWRDNPFYANYFLTFPMNWLNKVFQSIKVIATIRLSNSDFIGCFDYQ